MFFFSSICFSLKQIKTWQHDGKKHGLVSTKHHVSVKKHETRRKSKYTERKEARFWENYSKALEFSGKCHSVFLVSNRFSLGKPIVWWKTFRESSDIFGKARSHQISLVFTKKFSNSPKSKIQQEEELCTARNFRRHVFLSCFLCLLPGSIMFSLITFDWKSLERFFFAFRYHNSELQPKWE